MRIAVLTYATQPRGGVVHVLALGDALHARGHDVTVFAIGRPGERFFREPACPSYVVPMDARPSGIVEFVRGRIAAYVASFAASNERFDIYHAHDGISGNALAELRAVGRVPGFVRTVHHLDAFDEPDLERWQTRSVVDAEHRITVSRLWRDRIRERFGLDADVIGNGVDTARFSEVDATTRDGLRRSLGFGDAPVFLAIGGIEERKNTIGIVRAFARVRADVPDARLVIVGGSSVFDHGAYRSAFDRVAAELGLAGENAPTVLGVLSDEELVAYLRAADALVFPSLREGFGLVVLEALACGTPVVASNIAPFTEYLRPADVAFVDPLDVASIAAGMRRALAPQTRTATRAAGPARMRDFTWDACARDHERAYDVALRAREERPDARDAVPRSLA